ncbi:GntR family transcriptional regulator [Paractinoplanes rishiriensis]|uniref:HTH gntR-type domain-containing protein n=1 Tax=Paractinoplanes rishiriensis TaxID=1050105 RepID=A0A919K9P0_9ACTN|nr:GntR family transcriptional regulator [Actinoplanes rishiriensis]GIF01411.1 hypothetical protein Ari01nite_88750 [Actinoplanes rishiriensis]
MPAAHDNDRRQVGDRLREAILRGEFLPGERLVEAQLMTRFGASRFNVRLSLPQHERVIQAVRSGDPKAAEAAMREHIASVLEALRSIDQLGGPA